MKNSFKEPKIFTIDYNNLKINDYDRGIFALIESEYAELFGAWDDEGNDYYYDFAKLKKLGLNPVKVSETVKLYKEKQRGALYYVTDEYGFEEFCDAIDIDRFDRLPDEETEDLTCYGILWKEINC